MTDAVLSGIIQAAPAGGIIFTVLVLLLRRESASDLRHREARAEWDAARKKQNDENDRLEKLLDHERANRRTAEDDLAAYKREHPS